MSLSRMLLVAFAVAFIAACGGGGGDGSVSNYTVSAAQTPPPPPLPAGSIALAASSYSVAQNVGLLTVTVNRTDGSRATSVSYATANGSAIADADYTARSGTLTWASGDADAKTISLPVNNTTQNAIDKTFNITLSNPTNDVTLGATTTATITITAAPQTGLAISVRGNRLVDGAGNVVQLRGVNFSGFEFVAVGGQSPTDPSGGNAGQPNGPKWSAIKAWHANTVSFALNEASWLGSTCTDTDNDTRSADPGHNYQTAIKEQVQQANAAGLYVILELHWAAPGTACPQVQTQMANMDHSIDFWDSVAATFKGNQAVIFSLYNEPFFYGLDAAQDPWVVMMKTGGTLPYYPASSKTYNYKEISVPWRTASMQAMLDAVRATGSTSVVLIGGVEHGNNMSKWLANVPSDPLNQLAAAWHPYPPIQATSSATVATGGSGYAVGDTITLARPNTVYAPVLLQVAAIGTNGAVTAVAIKKDADGIIGGYYLQTHLPTGAVAQASTSGAGSGATFTLGGWNNYSSTWSMPANWSVVQAISAKFPVVISETGEHNEPGTTGAPFMQELLPFADASNWSVVGCCWDVFLQKDNVLIKDVDGTPTDGYGKVFHDWMTGVAWQ